MVLDACCDYGSRLLLLCRHESTCGGSDGDGSLFHPCAYSGLLSDVNGKLHGTAYQTAGKRVQELSLCRLRRTDFPLCDGRHLPLSGERKHLAGKRQGGMYSLRDCAFRVERPTVCFRTYHHRTTVVLRHFRRRKDFGHLDYSRQ